MAVQIEFSTGLQPRDTQAKGDHLRSIERAEKLASNLARDNEETQRQQLDILKAPDLTLQADGVGKLIEL